MWSLSSSSSLDDLPLLLVIITCLLLLFIYFFFFFSSSKASHNHPLSPASMNASHQYDLSVRPSTVPRHVAVIMDGNRRFGRKLHNDPLKGHWMGGKLLTDFIQWCLTDSIEILTVYAFSTENWSREKEEIETLMRIFAKYAFSFVEEAIRNNIRVNILSTDVNRLPIAVRKAVFYLIKETKHCSGFQFNICLSYGGREDILSACNALVNDAIDEERQKKNRKKSWSTMREETKEETKEEESEEEEEDKDCNGEEEIEEIEEEELNEEEEVEGVEGRKGARGVQRKGRKLIVTEEMLSGKLSTASFPDPDILIRTSGERRLSNFLLWQLAYTELFFIDKCWPELTQADLRLVLHQFADRSRRFGS